MPLCPIFQSYPREQLQNDFNLTFGLSDWVAIELPVSVAKTLDPSFDADDVEIDVNGTVEYETNRYDAKFTDRDTGEPISAYFYMDEGSEHLIAVDTVVQSHKRPEVRYALEDTPFGNFIRAIQSKKSIKIK